jgi:hypothetical protein
MDPTDYLFLINPSTKQLKANSYSYTSHAICEQQ